MNYRRLSRTHERRHAQAGVSLVELMIAITLGLVAVGAAMSIFLANRKSFALVEGLARVQENARFAVDMLSRDIREAGGVVCGGALTSVNIVSGTNTWAVWDRGLVGNVLGSGTGQLAAPSGTTTAQISSPATHSLLVWSASSSTAPVQIVSHVPGTGTFTTATAPNYKANQVVTACDGSNVATFEVLQDTGTTGTSVKYTNPITNGISNTFAAGGFLNPLSARVWYVGKSTDSATPSSLRRLTLDKAGNYSNDNDEMVANVNNMQIQYLVGDATGAPAATAYVDAASVTDWTKVIAVRITLTLATQDSVGTTGSANASVSRTVPITVGIKRRLP